MTTTQIPRCIFCQLRDESEKRLRYECALKCIAEWPALAEPNAFRLDNDRAWLKQVIVEALAEPATQPPSIILNGKKVDLRVGTSVSYEIIVALAGYKPDRVLTVVYARGPTGGDGSLTPGQWVAVVPGMVFNVADTNNA